jgi:predicted anti-sigma-YlaC factor YlaD
MNETEGHRCDDVLACLDDYLDQEQVPEATHGIIAHLESCSACAARWEAAYQELATLRAVVQRMRAPAGLLDRLLAVSRPPDCREHG